MTPRLTIKQADELARLLKPQIEDFIREHWHEYIALLEANKDTDPQAAKELKETRAEESLRGARV